MADEYNVTCKAIYELHAEFSSMIKINQHEELNNPKNPEDSDEN